MKSDICPLPHTEKQWIIIYTFRIYIHIFRICDELEWDWSEILLIVRGK